MSDKPPTRFTINPTEWNGAPTSGSVVIYWDNAQSMWIESVDVAELEGYEQGQAVYNDRRWEEGAGYSSCLKILEIYGISPERILEVYGISVLSHMRITRELSSSMPIRQSSR